MKIDASQLDMAGGKYSWVFIASKIMEKYANIINSQNIKKSFLRYPSSSLQSGGKVTQFIGETFAFEIFSFDDGKFMKSDQICVREG